MDDPWGSPWASDANSKPDLAPPSPLLPPQFLSPPPRAFFGSSPNLPGAQSPWADDDGPGVWGGATKPDPKPEPSDWGVWSEPPGVAPAKLDIPGKPSPLARPDTGSPLGLKPLPRSRSPSVFRQYSPDPWAAERSWNDRQDVSPVALAPRSPRFDQPGDVGLGLKGGSTPSLRLEAAKDDDVASALDLQISEQSELKPAKVRAPKPTSTSPRRGSTLDVDPPDTSPRPSSTFSVDSGNAREADRQDSPITSIDEDARPRLDATSRKSSGKVQELVGKYDGLEKGLKHRPSLREKHELPMRSVSRETSPGQPAHPKEELGKEDLEMIDDDPSFGDFEESHQVFDEPLTTSTKTGSVISDRSATPKAADVESRISTPDQKQDDLKDSEVSQSPEPCSTTAPVQDVLNRYGPIQFHVSTEALDSIFSKDDGKASSQDGDVGDRLVTDSFSSISERKTWYRVSRYGSMRKHDLGDDENYHPVSWKDSNIHGETINIVRRWMEEDSYSGRPTLGNGRGKRTGVFNWESADTADSPVDLNSIFARKSSGHAKKPSVSSPGRRAAPSIDSFGSSATPPKADAHSQNIPQAATPTTIPAGFGSSPPSGKSTASGPTTIGIPPPGPVELVQKAQKAAFRASAPTPLTLKNGPPLSAPLATPGPEEDDDDEDWGDMVTSPTNPVQAPLNPPFTPVQQMGPVPPQRATPNTGPGTFDDASKPGSLDSRVGQSPLPAASVEPISNRPSTSLSSRPTSLMNEQFSRPVSLSGAVANTVAEAKETPVAGLAALPTGLGAAAPVTPQSTADDDEFVKSVVDTLPDLTYMLHD